MPDLKESDKLRKNLKRGLSRILKNLRDNDMPADKKRDAVNKGVELYSMLGIEPGEGDKKIIAEINNMK